MSLLHQQIKFFLSIFFMITKKKNLKLYSIDVDARVLKNRLQKFKILIK